MSRWLLYAVSAVIAYILGSVSTGILVARAFHGPDLRTVGSKNTGATNVQRTMGALFCGFFVILGHNWPVFFRFKGGKGVASSCGVMLYCFPVPALICFAVAVLIIVFTKYVSLASMTMLTLYAILISILYSGGDLRIILWACVLAALCLIRHRANIARLIQGKENKLGQRIKTS